MWVGIVYALHIFRQTWITTQFHAVVIDSVTLAWLWGRFNWFNLCWSTGDFTLVDLVTVSLAAEVELRVKCQTCVIGYNMKVGQLFDNARHDVEKLCQTEGYWIVPIYPLLDAITGIVFRCHVRLQKADVFSCCDHLHYFGFHRFKWRFV